MANRKRRNSVSLVMNDKIYEKAKLISSKISTLWDDYWFGCILKFNRNFCRAELVNMIGLIAQKLWHRTSFKLFGTNLQSLICMFCQKEIKMASSTQCENFRHLLSWNQNSEPLKHPKMIDFVIYNSLILFSRKIWAIWKFLNCHTVHAA